MMKVTEKPMTVALEPPYEAEYQQLMNEYFIASERNSRMSSIEEKKRLMAVKEKMALLCHRNPEKSALLKSLILNVRGNREKMVIISKSNAAAADLYDALGKDEEMKGVLMISTELSIHEVNQMNDRFNKSRESTVLIVTDAVNPGLDLTAANHLLHYDYPVRYTEILQRNNRLTRATSPHDEVIVYYPATSGKIDEFEYRENMKEKAAIDRVMSTV